MSHRWSCFRSTDLQRIEQQTFVAHIEFYEELPSTNDRALELARRQQLEMPLLVLAAHQTAGRGRGNNRWWSAPGALTCSLVLDVQSGAAGGQLSLICALAVCRAVEVIWPPARPQLKWPNDVLAQQRKLCGILVERPSAGAGRAVVGIGINVNNSLAAAPPNVRQRATALCDLAGRTFPLDEVLVELLRQIDVALRLRDHRPQEMYQQWHERCALRGRRVRLQAGDQSVQGLCRGIDPEGALVVETPQGSRRWFSAVVKQYE